MSLGDLHHLNITDTAERKESVHIAEPRMHLNSFFFLLNKNHEPSSEQHADELIVNDNSFKVTLLLSSVTGVSSK